MKLIFEYEEEKITGHVPDADDFDNGSGSGNGSDDHYDNGSGERSAEEDRVDKDDRTVGKIQGRRREGKGW